MANIFDNLDVKYGPPVAAKTVLVSNGKAPIAPGNLFDSLDTKYGPNSKSSPAVKANFNPNDIQVPNPNSVGNIAGDIGAGLKKTGLGVLNFAKEVGQGIARSGASVGATITSMYGGSNQLVPEGKIQQAVFGKEPVKSLDTRILEAVPKTQELSKKYLGKNLSKGGAAAISGPVILGLTGLDFAGFGGEEKSAIKALASASKVEEVANILKKINVAGDIAKEYAPIIAKTSKEAEVIKVVEHISELQKTTKPFEGSASPTINTIRQELNIPENAGAVSAKVSNPIREDLGLKNQRLYLSHVPAPAEAPINTVKQQLMEASGMKLSDHSPEALKMPGQAGSATNLKDLNAYTPTVAQSGGPVERGFLTSLKEDPLTAKVFASETNNYTKLSNSVTAAKARNLIKSNPEAAKNLAYSSEKSADAVATRIELIKNAVKDENWEEVKRLGNYTAKEGTTIGQAAQAHALLGLNMDTPEKAIVHAAQEIEKSNNIKMPKFAGKLDELGRQIGKLHEDTIDRVVKDIPDLAPKIEKPTSLEAKIAKREIAPAEELAARITPYYKTKAPNPIKDMLSTLYKLAQEQLPAKGKVIPRDAIDLIGQALRDKNAYKDTWLQAQDIIRQKWADEPEAIALLDKYFNKTLLSGETTHAALPVAEKQIGTAIKQGIKSEGIDLSKIVREHYTIAETAGKDLTTKLVEKANVPAKEAAALSQKIQAKFSELTASKKESILKTIFNDRAITKDKSFVEKIIQMTNLGAFDKAALQEKLAGKLGLGRLTDDLAKKLSNQASIIQKMDYGYQKFKQTQKLLEMIKDQLPVSKLDLAGNILNLPRSLMSSFDLSFPLRQGLFAASSFPKEFASSFSKEFKMFGSQKAYEDIMDLTMKHPDFGLAEKAGVQFTDIGSTIGKREEAFQSQLAEKIPILGMGVKASSRAYTGMANKLRMDVFASMVKDAERLGLNPKEDMNLAKDIGMFVNNATGRGSLGQFEKAAPLLNSVFFSPRLMMSRLALMNPMYYIKAEPLVRKQALKSLLTYAGSTATVLGLAKMAGAQVTVDPRNSDFGKIKIGNTRLDIMGGFQQYIRMASQLVTGKYISSTTGKEYTLGEGYKPLTRLDIVMRQLQSKESPVTSFITDMLRGTDYAGNNINTPKGVATEVAQRFTPMVLQDIRDLYKSDPTLLPLGALATFGVGLQTYAPIDSKASSGSARGNRTTNKGSTRSTKR